MTIKKIVLIALVSGLSFVTTSCKKDKEKTRTELLTNNWKQTAGTEQIGTGATTDVFTSLSNCSKDDIWAFKSGGAFESNEGATKCDPSDPQVQYTGTWALANSDNDINLNVGGSQVVVNILELSETTLKYKFVDQGDTYVNTYTKQ